MNKIIIHYYPLRNSIQTIYDKSTKMNRQQKQDLIIERRSWVYVMKNPCIKDEKNNCLLKVGVSDTPTKGLSPRTKTMGTNPEPYKIVFAKYMKNPYKKESQIKNMFKDFR